MGQGAYFGIATLVMEELDGDWAQVDVIGASGNPALYGNLAWGGVAQGTGGSTSMTSSWQRYRQAGAAARAMLVAAAAKQWSVPAGEITVASGIVSHASGKRYLRRTRRSRGRDAGSHGVAAEAEGAMDADRSGQAEALRFGRQDERHQAYTIDLKMDGLLTAVMIHPPKFGAEVKSFDATKAKAFDGVVDVVQTPRGVAVVGRNMWAALKGRELVTVEWDELKAEQRGSAEILAEYRKIADGPAAATARNDGDVAAALSAAASTVEAHYEFPYLAHASLEPLNAIARMGEDGVIEVWGGHQMPDLYQAVAAQVGGVTPDKVRLHVMKTGGSFGRRAVADADLIVEAVATARALGWKAPVKVQWTRENDMRGGRYRPAYVHAIKAGLDKDGRLVALHDHIVGQSILGGSPFAAMIKDGVDATSVEGASNLPLRRAEPEDRPDHARGNIPVLWWRSVGSTHTAYAMETFIDEVAAAAKRDPVEFRLSMLDKHPRHAAVLRLAAEKAGWGRAAAGRPFPRRGAA